MPHALFRLREKTLNTPQLMSVQGFDAIAKYLDDRCSKDFKLQSDEDGGFGQVERYSFNQDLGVATLSIDGPLSYRPITMMGFDCGGTSYTQLKEDFTYLVESGAKTIALMIDSPGGEAHGLFPTAQYMRDLADANGVKILAFADGMSASAGYGLTSIADEIIVSPGSEVGSIGVVVRLMNDSKALEKEGYERSFVYAGSSKVPYAEDGSFRPDFINDIQSKVDSLYVEFVEFVATQRNLSSDSVKSTEARTFLPKEAMALGLIDAEMTVESFYNYLADTAQKPQENGMLKNKLFNMKTNTEETPNMTQTTEMQAQLAQYQEQLAEFSSVKEAHATLLAALTEKETLLSAALSEVAQMKEAVASAEAAAVAVKMDARKSKLAAVMSADKLEGVSASLSSLDDSAFETVLSGFAAQKQALEASDMFTEIGDQGTEAVVETTSKSKDVTEDLIKQKLGLK
jgi:ClpP class serine protease